MAQLAEWSLLTQEVRCSTTCNFISQVHCHSRSSRDFSQNFFSHDITLSVQYFCFQKLLSANVKIPLFQIHICRFCSCYITVHETAHPEYDTKQSLCPLCHNHCPCPHIILLSTLVPLFCVLILDHLRRSVVLYGEAKLCLFRP